MIQKLLSTVIMCISMLMALPVQAKDDATVTITMTDGSVKKGTLSSDLLLMPDHVKYTDAKGQKEEVSAEDVKRMTVVEDGKELIFTAETVTTRGTFGNKTQKGKRLVQMIYEGKKACCYVTYRYDMDVSRNALGGMMGKTSRKPEYYFKAPGMSDIRSFYFDQGTTFTIGGKAALKKFFKAYPDFVKLIADGEITYKQMQADPAAFIKRLDETLQ